MSAALRPVRREGKPSLRHFLDLSDHDSPTLRHMLDLGMRCKRGEMADRPLAGKTVALIFEKPSTRTRVSFEVGIRQLGGDVGVLSGKDSQLGRGESPADTARVLSRYVDAIMLRTDSAGKLCELVEHATVPVINGLTDLSHPCQIMADVMTFEEHRGPIADKKVVWSGDGNNVFASFAHAAGQFGFDLTFTGPKTLDPEPEWIDFARAKGVQALIERDPYKAVEGADLVVTDTWVSMHDPESAKERRHNQLRGYQVNEALMAQAKPDALFMHCLPAHRDDEATSAVMDGPHSVIFDEAENRLHAQKAIMRWCLGA